MRTTSLKQKGSSLIEVLVTILILSFGMLSLAGMMAYAVQMPKLSAYRSTAVMLGAGHVERMRANVKGFDAGDYTEKMTFAQNVTAVIACAYPNCGSTTIATADRDASHQEIRRELPQGGMRVICNGACSNHEGDLWVMWQEPSTFAAINAVTSDECPDPTVAPTFVFASQPRCIHIRFKL
jgi:type IV pilus assembly protein PilV